MDALNALDCSDKSDLSLCLLCKQLLFALYTVLLEAQSTSGHI